MNAITTLTGRPLPPSSLPATTAALDDLAAAVALLPAVGETPLPQAPFDPAWPADASVAEADA